MSLWGKVKQAMTMTREVKDGFDSKAFFTRLRNGPCRHRKSKQVAGTEAILEAMQGQPVSWTAYALATAWHETAATMQPIKEYGGRAYFMRMYDKTGKRPHVAKVLGNTVIGDGASYAGRGYAQLTGRANYLKAQIETGENLIGNPDLAMQPDIAAEIMRAGMLEGWFTGKRFATYLPPVATHEQFRQSRRIINGMDKAELIADYANEFQDALKVGGWA